MTSGWALMRLLFDTHSFLWWDRGAEELSTRVRSLCEDPANELVVSVVSVWEMQVKHRLGKLPLSHGLREIVERQQAINGVKLLSVELEHVLALGDLPDAHRDPFDRLLIAQAKAEGMAILTKDALFNQYPVVVIW
jgi:PIN domain nuclease of toxin-antitoxin system